jgi:hypothetical protein
MAARKPKKRSAYANVKDAHYINVPVSDAVIELVDRARAAAIAGGMRKQAWVERALRIQATAELGGAE